MDQGSQSSSDLQGGKIVWNLDIVDSNFTAKLQSDSKAAEDFSKNLDKNTTAASGSLDKLRSTFSMVGSVTAGILAANGIADAFNTVKDAIIGTISSAADFQTKQTQLVTGAGELQKNLGLVANGIDSIAINTGSTLDQLENGMYMIESAGFHGASGLKILTAAAEASKTTNADLQTVADGVTSALNAYSMSGDQATKITNTLIAAVASGKMHMQDLAGSLGMVLPSAAALKIPIEQVVAAIATMTEQGTPAAEAATYMRFTLESLARPTGAATAEFKKLGISSSEVTQILTSQGLPAAIQFLTDSIGKKFPEGSAGYIAAASNVVGGTRGMQAMLELTGPHLSTFKDNVDNVTNAVSKAGNQVTGWTLTQQNFNQKWSELQELFQVSSKNIGETLLPVLSNMIGSFEDALPALSNLSKQVANYLSPDLYALWDTLSKKLMPAFGNFWHEIIEPLLPIIGVTLVVAIKAVADIFNTLFTFITPVIKFMADHKDTVYALATAFIVFKGTLMIWDAIDAVRIGLTTLQLITIPNLTASMTAFKLLVSSPVAMGSIAVAGALADIALVAAAVQAVVGAINAMNQSNTSIANNVDVTGGIKQQETLLSQGKINKTQEQKAIAALLSGSDASYSLSKKASGGPVSAGQPVWVGDNPDGSLNSTSELFVPDVAGTIVPSNGVKGMMGSRTNRPINVTYNVYNTTDQTRFLRDMAWQMGNI